MNEESKQQKPEEKEKPQAAPAEASKPAEEKKAAPVKKPRPKECVSCSRSIKKKWYYRDNNYYCGKSCWEKTKKEKAQAEGQEKK